MKKTALVIGMFALLLQGCATPHVVQTKKVSDVNLSCPQILSEIEEADRFEKEARICVWFRIDSAGASASDKKGRIDGVFEDDR